MFNLYLYSGDSEDDGIILFIDCTTSDTLCNIRPLARCIKCLDRDQRPRSMETDVHLFQGYWGGGANLHSNPHTERRTIDRSKAKMQQHVRKIRPSDEETIVWEEEEVPRSRRLVRKTEETKGIAISTLEQLHQQGGMCHDLLSVLILSICTDGQTVTSPPLKKKTNTHGQQSSCRGQKMVWDEWKTT